MVTQGLGFMSFIPPSFRNQTSLTQIPKRLCSRRPKYSRTPAASRPFGVYCSDDFDAGKRVSQEAASSSKPSISTLTQKIAQARDTYRKVSDEVQALHDSPDGLVLGSDLADYSLGANSLVQDVTIPAAPKFWGLAPNEVLTQIDDYLQENYISETERGSAAESCRKILSALRGWTHQYADKARPMLTPGKDGEPPNELVAEQTDALVTLLQMGGFAILPDLPEIDDPPVPDALALGNSIQENLDPTLMQQSAKLRDHVAANGFHIGPPSYYPHLFVATRGSTLVRNSGLLISQKMRAIERTYLGWVKVPFTFISRPIRAVKTFLKDVIVQAPQLSMSDSLNDSDRMGSDVDGASAKNKKEAPQQVQSSDSSSPSSRSEDRVRRVVPAVRIGRSWEALRGVFLPAFTQEPAYEYMLLLHREIDLDKDSIRKQKAAAIRRQMTDTVKHAMNPFSRRETKDKSLNGAESSSFDKFERAPGTPQPVSLQLFKGVVWGKIHHFYPSTFVLPVTRDLLRIDAITFTGLVSTIFTFLRQAGSKYVFAVLAGSLISYVFRVGSGWRKAALVYNGTIADDRVEALMAKQKGCLDCLAELAAEELFVEVSCVWLSANVDAGMSPQGFQKDIFGRVNLTDEIIDNWKDWLASSNV